MAGPLKKLGGACCTQGPAWEGTTTGRERRVEGADGAINIYLSEPRKHTSKAVILIHDIFGYRNKNLRLLADAFAKEGFLAAVPDLINNDPFPGTGFHDVYSKDKEGQQKLGAWLGKHGVKSEETHAQLRSLMHELQEHSGIERIFVEGICWGGNYAVQLAATDKVDGVYVAHGSLMEPSQIEAVKRPTFFGCAQDDEQIPSDFFTQIQEIMSSKSVDSTVKQYPGTTHGFSIRGAWDNKGLHNTTDSQTTAGAEQAFQDAVMFFKKQAGEAGPQWLTIAGVAAAAAAVAAVGVHAYQRRQ